jgi:hypothetical protein
MDYHGDIRANGEYGWKKYNGVLKPGNFYLMTVDGGRDIYRMKKLKEADIVSKHSVKVNAYNGVGETTDKGWNGVGNSCWTYVNVDCNIQVLNPETYTYELFVANSKDVAVGIPFFIQADSDKEIELSVSNENVLYSPARMNNAAIQMSISFGNKDYTDKLYVSISDDAESTYVIGNDLVKMSMTATPVVPQISAFAYDVRLCMVDLPWRHNEASVDLSLYAPCDGDYCLNGSDIYDVDVYLAYDGMIVGQVSDNEYYMPLKKGANSGYSLVIYRKNVSTDNMSNLSSVNHVKKLIYKGRLYVLYNNQVFGVQGNILKNEYE